MPSTRFPPGRCPPTAAPTSWWAPSARAGARYPLRLLGLSLSYRLPGFPASPGGGAAARAAARTGRRSAARPPAPRWPSAPWRFPRGPRAASRRRSPGRPPWARGTLRRPPRTSPAPVPPGSRPPSPPGGPRGAGAALTFTVGAGHLAQRGGLAPLPVTGQLVLTAGAPRLPIPVLATRAFLSSSGARLGQIVPLPVGNADVPVRLTAQVRAFPATGGTGPALIIDQAWLQQALAAQSQPPLPVTAVVAGRQARPPGWAARRGHRGDHGRVGGPAARRPAAERSPALAAGDRGGGRGAGLHRAGGQRGGRERRTPPAARPARGPRRRPGRAGRAAVPGAAHARRAGRGGRGGHRGRPRLPADPPCHSHRRRECPVPPGTRGDPAGLDRPAGAGASRRCRSQLRGRGRRPAGADPAAGLRAGEAG